MWNLNTTSFMPTSLMSSYFNIWKYGHSSRYRWIFSRNQELNFFMTLSPISGLCFLKCSTNQITRTFQSMNAFINVNNSSSRRWNSHLWEIITNFRGYEWFANSLSAWTVKPRAEFKCSFFFFLLSQYCSLGSRSISLVIRIWKMMLLIYGYRLWILEKWCGIYPKPLI